MTLFIVSPINYYSSHFIFWVDFYILVVLILLYIKVIIFNVHSYYYILFQFYFHLY